MTLHFEWFGFDDAARMALAHGLRKEVFVDEQGFSLEADRDEQDKNALHVLGLDETGAARCTARVFADAPGVWHAGRIAVQRGLRGQGVGRLLLAAVADKARAQGRRWLPAAGKGAGEEACAPAAGSFFAQGKGALSFFAAGVTFWEVRSSNRRDHKEKGRCKG